MKNNTHESPKLARWILTSLRDFHDQYSIVDEIDEVYGYTCKAKGTIIAKLWYWYQTLVCCQKYLVRNFTWSMIMFTNYFKVALRNIVRSKGYSAINITGLATGLACCILIFLWVRDELSYDRFHNNSDSIYRVVMKNEGWWTTTTQVALVTVLRQDFPEIEKSTRLAGRSRMLRSDEYQNYEQGAFVEPDFFDMFSFPFIKGDPHTALNDRNSIVITETLANKLYPGEDPVGKLVTVENRTDVTITGIVRDVPSNSTIQFEFLMPVQLYSSEERLNTSWSTELWTFVQLKEGVDPDEFGQKISGVAMKYDKRTTRKRIMDIQNISRMHLYRLSGGGPIQYVYIFSVVAIFILLIACINFTNLATAKSDKRAKEIGMRKVVGALKSDIIRQFYGESFIAGIVSLFISLLLVWFVLPFFNSVAEKQFVIHDILQTEVVLSLILITLVTGIIAGSYPALLLSAFRPADVLKASKGSRNTRYGLRRILVVGQFTATVVLIISTIALIVQMDYIRNKDLGLDKEHIVAVTINSQLRPHYRVLKEELKRNENIINITAASSIPTMVGNINPVYWEGKTREDLMTIRHVEVDYDYFDTFGMQLSAGRAHSQKFPTDTMHYVINQAALRLTELDDPIGKMFSIWEREGQIIGIVKDFHNLSLHSEISPTVFSPRQNQLLHRYIFVKMRPENIRETMAVIENKVNELAPQYPFTYTFLEDVFDRQYSLDRRIGNIFKYFSGLAIFISCLGLLGMASFVAQQRTREIGIRKVLGASASNILLLVSKEFLALVVIANLIAWPASYFVVNKLFSTYAYRTDISIWFFAISGAISILIATSAVSAQTIKAALLNPVKSLKHE